MVRGKLVYLKQICGDVWQGQGAAPDTQAKEKAAEIAAQIEAKAEALNLSVRHGIFEPLALNGRAHRAVAPRPPTPSELPAP